MPLRRREGRALLAGALASMAIHLSAVLWLLPGEPAPRAAPYQVPLEALSGPPSGGADARGRAPAGAERPIPGGSTSAQNIDARDRGQGGEATGARDAILLMQRDEGVILFDSPLNNLAAAQSQRIRTARDRATLERRRATPNPSDAPFLASGPGTHRERRPVSTIDAARGARRAPEASLEGHAASGAQDREGSSRGVGEREASSPGANSPGVGERGAHDDRLDDPGTRADGSAYRNPPGAEASPGVGILDGRGPRPSEAARVAHDRPPVDEGPAATQAEAVDPRVRDRDDAELLARSMMQSWVESTRRSAPQGGEGSGGVGGGGAPGSGGGTEEGGRAARYGPGDGRFDALDTGDARYRRWFLASSRRVQDALRFPRERALAMDQGTSVYSVRVRRDGTLASAPRLVRSSGFDDLDQAALAAIRAATPFAPLPGDLAPELSSLSIRLPIEFSNPMVR